MINVYALIASIIIIILNYAVLHALKNKTLSLRNSILFLINAIILIILTEWITKITDVNDVTYDPKMDKIIHFNVMIITIRNSVVLIAFSYLTYSAFKEFVNCRKIVWLLISVICAILTVLTFIGCIIMNSFTI